MKKKKKKKKKKTYKHDTAIKNRNRRGLRGNIKYEILAGLFEMYILLLPQIFCAECLGYEHI